jgi:prevent-host-death family protein
MKTVTAKEAKNRFGQLIDDAQRQPVTVEKNGRPFVVVQSFEDFQISQQLKMTSLRAAIDEARAEYADGHGMPFDQAAVKKIMAAGRRRLSERDRKR